MDAPLLTEDIMRRYKIVASDGGVHHVAMAAVGSYPDVRAANEDFPLPIPHAFRSHVTCSYVLSITLVDDTPTEPARDAALLLHSGDDYDAVGIPTDAAW